MSRNGSLVVDFGGRGLYAVRTVAKGGNDTDIGGSERGFQSTLWTVVLDAKELSSEARLVALQQLIQTYWKPLYFFVRRKGNGPEECKDLIQGFFTALLDRDYLKYVERGKGKFRTFLLTALEHYVADEYDKAKAQKRGGGKAILSIDFTDAETGFRADDGAGPEKSFEQEWAYRVLSQALSTLRDDFEALGKLQEFEALRSRLVVPREDEPYYSEIARTLGITETDVKNRVRSLRARYREAILSVIRGYTDSDEAAREELRDLFSAFK